MLLKVLFSLFLIYFIKKVEALDNGLALTPPMGWSSISFQGNPTNETLIRNIAEHMVTEGYKDAGYNYIFIDGISWNEDLNKTLSALYPNGFKSLVDHIHGMGLKLGISYNLTSNRTNAKMFIDWGIDYIRADAADMNNDFAEFGKLLNESGHNIMYSCNWIQNNTTTLFSIQPMSKICNLWQNWHANNENYESLRKTMDHYAEAELRPYTGSGHWNDPGVLISGLTPKQTETQMAIWAILPAPIFMSHDLRSIGPEIKTILLNKNVIAVNQDALEIQGKRANSDNGIELWTRPVTPVVNGSYSYAVAWTSTRNETTLFQTELKKFGLLHVDGYNVTDLFDGNEKLLFQWINGNFTVKIGPSETIFYKFTPIPLKPRTDSNCNIPTSVNHNLSLCIFFISLIILLAAGCFTFLKGKSAPSSSNMRNRYEHHTMPLMNHDNELL